MGQATRTVRRDSPAKLLAASGWPWDATPEVFGTVRAASGNELAALYSLLSSHGLISSTVAPTIVFAYPGHGLPSRYPDLAGCAEQMLAVSAGAELLRKFGVGVTAITLEEPHRYAHLGGFRDWIMRPAGDEAEHLPHVTRDGIRYLARATYLLGGTLHGMCAEQITDGVRHAEAMIALVQRERLRAWAAAVTADGPVPVFTRAHVNGSDSIGVLQFRTDRDIVAKVGDLDMIRAEVQFITSVNTRLAQAGYPPLLPELYGVHIEGDQAASLMEAVNPVPIDTVLFADAARTELKDGALEILEPYLDRLAAWHRLTAQPRQPTVARYLYGERFHVLPGHPGFTSTFHALCPGWDLDDTLSASVVLPGGLELPGYTAATGWLDGVSASLLPVSGSGVHGDIHLKNLLRRLDGSPVLVDPRTVWDGRDRPDIGYGDPVYDFSTLLHSVLPMSAVLEAVTQGTTPALLRHLPGKPSGIVPLDLSGLTLPLRFSQPLRRLESRLLSAAPAHEPPAVVRTRLYIGAANSLAGWLKFQRSLRTHQAWLVTYAYAVWYLWRAREVWDAWQEEQRGAAERTAATSRGEIPQ